ncbi:MAG: hypothetical protein ABWY48_07395, partial [Pseudoxanthomonas sp.]
MVSFFRRKKPASGAETPPETDATRRYSLEELAAAFPAPTGESATAQPDKQPSADPAVPVETPPEALVPTSQPPAATEADRPAPASAGKPGWRERLRGTGFARGLGGLFSRNPKLDDDLLDEIETA